MASGVTTTHLRTASAGVVAGVVIMVGLVVVIGAAALTSDAAPTGINRPALTPDPLAGPCWPLPTERRLGFPYQVRGDEPAGRDASGDRRRVLTIQYDQVDAGEVREDVDDLLTSAGFVATADHGFTLPGYGTVLVDVTPFPDLAADSIVRGVLELDLPSRAARKEARGCTLDELAS